MQGGCTCKRLISTTVMLGVTHLKQHFLCQSMATPPGVHWVSRPIIRDAQLAAVNICKATRRAQCFSLAGGRGSLTRV